VETQSPSTNTNGLFTVQIGAGSLVSGDFSSINWSNGPYFIKTEVDPQGGSSFSISGTSQLISVPYALHANSSDTLTGTITESQVTGLNYTVDTQIDSTGITELGFVAGPQNEVYEVGDTALGGVVFWVDKTGTHGLVVSPTQLSLGVSWWTGVSGNTMGRGEGLFSGEMNTTLAIVLYGEDDATYPTNGKYAARLCTELTETQGGVVYGGWYLPSKEELNQIRINRSVINTGIFQLGGQQVSSAFYWSSTETADGKVWGQNMSSGIQMDKLKASTYSVRAIRRF